MVAAARVTQQKKHRKRSVAHVPDAPDLLGEPDNEDDLLGTDHMEDSGQGSPIPKEIHLLMT